MDEALDTKPFLTKDDNGFVYTCDKGETLGKKGLWLVRGWVFSIGGWAVGFGVGKVGWQGEGLQ